MTDTYHLFTTYLPYVEILKLELKMNLFYPLLENEVFEFQIL